MRTSVNDYIWNIWNNGGPFVGEDAAPNCYVTVEVGWQLTESSNSDVGNFQNGPIRWFQRADNSQLETVVPNIQSVDIDRTIDVDAGTCKIVMVNQLMINNDDTSTETGSQGESLGRPGYYWPARGESVDSVTLWGQEQNPWGSVLQPNALIRTYQGYGGKTKSLQEALLFGNVILTGLWLVDSVEMDAQTGLMTISCRDMAKLVIEQSLYPPLVPTTSNAPLHKRIHYPLYLYKFVYVNHPVVPYGPTVYKTGFQPIDGKLSNAAASSYYNQNGVSHPPRDAADAVDWTDGRDPDTYWLSAGSANYQSVEYLQFNCNNASIQGINVQPFGGNVRLSVAITGTKTADAQGNPLSTALNNQIVVVQGIGWEQAQTIDLQGTYTVATIRLIFDKLPKLGPQPLPYRAGVRDFQIGVFTNSVGSGGRKIFGIARGSNTDPNGYWLCGTDGAVYPFGHLKYYGSEGNHVLNGAIVGMASDSVSGAGYRLVGQDGGVFDFGDLYYHGSMPGKGLTVTDAVGIENGDAGHTGYYVVEESGTVTPFGTATFYGNGTFPCAGMAVSQVVGRLGYWTVSWNGTVQAHGGVTHYGDVSNPTGVCVAIESTSTALGYWVVDVNGAVYSFGDAVYHGGAQGLQLAGGITDMVRTPSDGGYWICGDDGGVFAFGDAPFYGSLPEQFNAVDDGNYNDYTDIITDILLWCGWWFRDPRNPGADPVVFGNLESTGIYSPDNLTSDFFDKKPCVDVINTIKEVVSYITFVDDIGAYHFHPPNIFKKGNFLDTGVPTTRMAVIDEMKQITAYTENFNDTDARSQITIATEDPALNIPDTQSVTIDSQWAGPILRGIVKNALWVNGRFLTETVQNTMAHLIDLQLFMQSRQGQLSMPANPIIMLDDQVQIIERSTSETYVHYVRGYKSHQDMLTGEYSMDIQTHWLGDGASWAINYTPAPPIDITTGGGGDSPDVAPHFTTASPPSGNVGANYGYLFIAAGNPTPTYSVTAGTLPPGLNLAIDGTLNGIPTTAGTYSFTVRASNGTAPDATANVSVTVSQTTQVAPSFQNATPPNGQTQSGYSYTFVATGDPLPTFSITAGSLPTGLSLNSTSGSLTGTPTSAGTSSFTITATNSAGTDTANCVVIISTPSSGGTTGGSFLSYPMHSTPTTFSSQSNVVLSGQSYQNINDVAIQISNCTNVYIHDIDIDACVGGIFLIGCSGQIRIENIRARNIGDGTTGSGHSNIIQLNTTFDDGTGGIRNVVGYGGNTEDMISIYQSGGLSPTQQLIIENNHLQSPLPPDPEAWQSNSGSGFLLADVSGHDIVCRNNTMLDCGQVGIGNSRGVGVIIHGNIIYGSQRVNSNVGIYTPYSGGTYTGNNEVSNNRIYWLDANGNPNSIYTGSEVSGPIIGLDGTDTNIEQDNTIDPHTLMIDPTTMIMTGGGSGTPGGSSSPPPSGGYFSVLAVGASLPGGMTAAGADAAANAAVHRSTWEPRPENNTANQTIVGQPNQLANFHTHDSTWNSTYLPRISGNIGIANPTTDEIFQWAAYKWGWSDELVRAEAVTESTWRQSTLGDYEPASNGHRVYDRTDDPSPTSFSIIQVRWYYHPEIVSQGGTVTSSSDPHCSYPGIHISTAFAVDLFMAYLRGIYDGHSTYLNGGGMAASGDFWGAIGAWFSGGWHDSGANSYIATTQGHFNSKPWLNSGF